MAGGDSSKWSNLIRVGTSSCATLIRSTVVPLFSPPLFSCLVGRERERESRLDKWKSATLWTVQREFYLILPLTEGWNFSVLLRNKVEVIRALLCPLFPPKKGREEQLFCEKLFTSLS